MKVLFRMLYVTNRSFFMKWMDKGRYTRGFVYEHSIGVISPNRAFAEQDRSK